MGCPILIEDNGPFDVGFYRCLRYRFDESLLDYVRFFLQLTEGTRFILSPHHAILSDVLDRVVRGEISRLIVNLPPGTTKTELAVKGLIGRELGRNPRARFIHVSASEDLALRNSSETRDVVASEEYRRVYPRTVIRPDVDSKKQWKTTQGGGVYSVATGGAVVGFRAGRMEPGFQGAMVIDDPHKPEDVYSDLKRKRQNERFCHTVRTRLATPETPIIVIMQRLHDEDLSGFLLRGGSGDRWHHLILPVEIPDAPGPYPAEYTHGIPIPVSLPPGPLWSYKYSREEIAILRSADPFTFSAQFLQAPTIYGGGVFRDSDWKVYRDYHPETGTVTLADGTSVRIEVKNVYADTAMKTGEQNDFSVFQLWGRGDDGRIYLLDQVRGRWEAPVLKSKFLRFCDRHEYGSGNAVGIRKRAVEDKASGTGLIQEINAVKGRDFVVGIPRDRDKFSRARSGTIAIAEGRVVIPADSLWVEDYRSEFREFSAYDTHTHDDQVDPTLDAISDLLVRSSIADKYVKLVGGFVND